MTTAVNDPIDAFELPTVDSAPATHFITDEDLQKSSNNLNAVRLILATAVIYSHSYYPLHDTDALKPLLGWPISWFAVDGFFVLSGFLVYRSLERRDSILDYAASRVSRIWPGLLVMAIMVGLMGMFFSRLSATAYMADPKFLEFVLGAATLRPHYELPGVQCGTALCNVNGSLWTIPWECYCYCILGILFTTAKYFGGRRAVVAALVASFALALLTDIPAVHGALAAKIGSKIYFVDQFSRLWAAFALGIALYIFRSRVPLNWIAAIGVLIAACLLQNTGFAGHARTVAAAYFVLCAGFRSGNFSANWGDYSFGMYIYAMPVLAMFITLGVHLHPIMLTLAVAAVTAPLAFASWHLVEKPALDMKSQLQRWHKARAATQEVGRIPA